MRLFIAINFDGETKKHIAAVQRRLREWGEGSFSRPENLHLTLAFLGEVAPRRVEELRRLLDGLVFPPLRLIFDRVGRFRQAGGDVWWVGLGPEPALLSLREALCRRLEEAGFPLDSRAFSPHVTLARRVVLREWPDSGDLLGAPFATPADGVSLMLSERTAGRLTYTELHRARAKTEGL